MSDDWRTIPDAVWLPIRQRAERFAALTKVSVVLSVIAALAMISVWWLPGWMAYGVGAPLTIVGLVLGRIAINGGKRALAEMRQLMIDNHGIDPNDPASMRRFLDDTEQLIMEARSSLASDAKERLN